MRLRVLKTALCLVFAAVAAGAWDLHMLGAGHAAGDDCQVCVVAGAPELNADCGSSLLVRPDHFVLTSAALHGGTVKTATTAAFRGRAPPL
ncbi:MAG TPA: hypothetical protein DCS63_05810 [Elusimicrobia bacterium]|nr:hypothetical protein [Elusimicrobiota bacterium]